MFSLQYSLLQDLFEQWRVFFFWRGSPGKEAMAVLHLPLSIHLEPYAMFITGGEIWSMGAFSYSQSTLPIETEVGRYCSIANAVTAFHSEHPVDWISMSPFSYNPDAAPLFRQAIEDSPQGALYRPAEYDDRSQTPIHIGNDVWIGQHAQLKKGIRIGDGAVIAAGAVVTRDVEPYSIVGGVPARLIRPRFDDRIVERLEKLQWWQYRFTDFHGLDPTNIERFLDGLEERTATAKLQKYSPKAMTLFTIKSHLQQKARHA